MCTLVMLRRPEARWPLMIAANRDELSTRPWKGPARHWPDRPDVVAGKDMTADGSWFGVNDDGVVAAILNRPGTLGPADGKRSRGELVLEALDHAEAKVAAEALADLDPESYRPFNLVVADRYDAFWLCHAGHRPSLRIRTPKGIWREIDPLYMPEGASFAEVGDHAAAPPAEITCRPIPSGLSMITANDLNDPTSPLIRHFLPRFRSAALPDPESGDWSAWIDLLGERTMPGGNPKHAINVTEAGAFKTVCSQLLALPAIGEPVMRFATGHPDEAPFEPVDLT
ncbi:MAG: NRDE family protein [Alphaproteobacteria bacterium]